VHDFSMEDAVVENLFSVFYTYRCIVIGMNVKLIVKCCSN